MIEIESDFTFPHPSRTWLTCFTAHCTTGCLYLLDLQIAPKLSCLGKHSLLRNTAFSLTSLFYSPLT